jgi:hypothetical protein
MFFAWSNGQQYSDHVIYFIETNEATEPTDRVRSLLEAIPTPPGRGGLVMTAEKVEWAWKGRGVATLADFWSCMTEYGPLAYEPDPEANQTANVKTALKIARELKLPMPYWAD